MSAISVSLLVHALRLLSIRPRSCHELELRLTQICERRKRSLRPSVRELFETANCSSEARSAVQTLADDGRIDDVSYASWHGNQRSMNRPRSRIKLRSELFQRGVCTSVALEECSKINEASAAMAIALRKTSMDEDALFKYLLRQGFPIEVVRRTVRLRGPVFRLGDEGDHSA